MRFRRRIKRVRVDIACPHGKFIPATFRIDGQPHQLGCVGCGFEVIVTAPSEQDA